MFAQVGLTRADIGVALGVAASLSLLRLGRLDVVVRMIRLDALDVVQTHGMPCVYEG